MPQREVDEATSRSEARKRRAETRAQDAQRRVVVARRNADLARNRGNARAAAVHDHEAAIHQRAVEIHLQAVRLQHDHARELLDGTAAGGSTRPGCGTSSRTSAAPATRRRSAVNRPGRTRCGRGSGRSGWRAVATPAPSAGGVEVLSRLLADAADADAAFVVVVHMAANARTALPEILHRSTGLECRLAEDGDPLESGRVLIAPPNRHLVVVRGAVAVVNAPRENRARPAIDPLFRTASIAYGPRVIAVALSGVLDDGTAGAAAVRRRGGVVVVQDPDDALFADIPRNIIQHVGADHVLPSAEIGGLVTRLSLEEVEEHLAFGEDEEPALARQDELLRKAQAGEITQFTCPECSGTLWEVDEDGIPRYRCRVGHVYSLEALRAAHSDGVETALWIAMRALEEQAGLIRRTAERSRGQNAPSAAARHELRAEEVEQQAQVIRNLLDRLSGLRERAGSAGG